MTPQHRHGIDESTGAQPQESTDADTGTPALDVRIDADRLDGAVDGALAIADECRMAFDDGMVLRVRDPADVAMAELELDRDAFETYSADAVTVGVVLDRLRDASSMADGDLIDLSLSADGRFDLTAGAVEYTFAPLAADAVRQVEWIEGETTAASVVMSGRALQRAVEAADLVADHATFVVEAEDPALTVTATGDTDEVCLSFDEADVESIDTGAGTDGPLESLYSVDYLADIVAGIPPDATVSVEFVGGGEGGCPLSLEHDFADGAGTGRWLLAPRIRR